MAKSIQKTVDHLSFTSTLSTVFSVLTFIFSLISIIHGYTWCYHVIQGISIAASINLFIWLVCGLKIIRYTRNINSKQSAAIKRLMISSVLLVFTPDILIIVLYFIPMLKSSSWISFISLISPLLVFIGWFLNKRVVKRMNN